MDVSSVPPTDSTKRKKKRNRRRNKKSPAKLQAAADAAPQVLKNGPVKKKKSAIDNAHIVSSRDAKVTKKDATAKIPKQKPELSADKSGNSRSVDDDHLSKEVQSLWSTIQKEEVDNEEVSDDVAESSQEEDFDVEFDSTGKALNFPVLQGKSKSAEESDVTSNNSNNATISKKATSAKGSEKSEPPDASNARKRKAAPTKANPKKAPKK